MALTLELQVQIRFVQILLTADVESLFCMQCELYTVQFYQITAIDRWERVMMAKRVGVTTKTVLKR